jgi:hypothetical protein
MGLWTCRLVYDRNGKHRVPQGDIHLVAVPRIGDVVMARQAYAVEAVLRAERAVKSQAPGEAELVLQVRRLDEPRPPAP